ncbi:MAG: hypothetical protein L6Q92_15440 [Phycisphaerae bacterium]|nr:hypothetical protein [Phycisphaerae bacterium]
MTELASLLATLFIDPVQISGGGRLLMLLPLAASVGVVYKTIRCDRVRDIPLASLVLWVTIVLGMLAVGVILLIAYQILR